MQPSIEPEDWEKEIDALKELLANDDDEGAWEWFEHHYPKCMKLIPVCRRAQFVEGVRRANEDGRIEL